MTAIKRMTGRKEFRLTPDTATALQRLVQFHKGEMSESDIIRAAIQAMAKTLPAQPKATRRIPGTNKE